MWQDRSDKGPAGSARMADCVLVVDDGGRLLATSPAADALLAGGNGLLRRDDGEILPACDDAGAFAAALRRLAARPGAEHLDVRGDAGTVGLTLTTLTGPRDGARIAIVAEPCRAPADRAALVAARFGLTGAEARVLALLCDGCAPSRMAERLAVAPTTVRTHLQRIFDKTDARRQSEVVRLVLTTVDRPLLSS